MGSTATAEPLVEVLGHLEVVLHRLEGLGIAIEPDVADARRGHQIQHAVEEPYAGAQDGDDHQLLALELRCLDAGQGRLDPHHGEGQVAQHLIGQQQRDLAEELAELGRGRLLSPHERELVPHQRVLDHGDVVPHAPLSPLPPRP